MLLKSLLFNAWILASPVFAKTTKGKELAVILRKDHKGTLQIRVCPKSKKYMLEDLDRRCFANLVEERKYITTSKRQSLKYAKNVLQKLQSRSYCRRIFCKNLKYVNTNLRQVAPKSMQLRNVYCPGTWHLYNSVTLPMYKPKRRIVAVKRPTVVVSKPKESPIIFRTIKDLGKTLTNEFKTMGMKIEKSITQLFKLQETKLVTEFKRMGVNIKKFNSKLVKVQEKNAKMKATSANKVTAIKKISKPLQNKKSTSVVVKKPVILRKPKVRCVRVRITRRGVQNNKLFQALRLRRGTRHCPRFAKGKCYWSPLKIRRKPMHSWRNGGWHPKSIKSLRNNDKNKWVPSIVRWIRNKKLPSGYCVQITRTRQLEA